MATLRKIKDAGLMFFRSGGANLENCCVTLLALKMNFICTPMPKTLPLIFVMLVQGYNRGY